MRRKNIFVGVMVAAGVGFVATWFVATKNLCAEPTASDVRRATAAAENLEVSATLHPEKPSLSDTLTLTLEVRHDPNWSIHPPSFGDRYGSFRVERVETAPAIISGDRQTDRFFVTLTPTEAGEVSLLPIPILAEWRADSVETSSDASGANRVESRILLPAGRVTIRSAFDPKQVSLSDIASARQAFPTRQVWFAAGLSILWLALSVLLMRMIRHRRMKAERNVVILTPSQRALAALDALFASNLHRSGVKKFYLELTGIVRRFIEEATSIRAPEQTTEEFLSMLQKRPAEEFDPSMRDDLAAFLEFSDLVKFAKFQPSESEIRDGFHKAREVVSHDFSHAEPTKESAKQDSAPQQAQGGGV